MGNSWRPVHRRRVVEGRDRPAEFDSDAVMADGNGSGHGNRAVRAFMQDRIGGPDDRAVMGLVLLDFQTAVVMVGLVRREVAVRDGVIVVVAARLMNVLRRQRRRERQKRRDEQRGGGPGDATSHSSIIEGWLGCGQFERAS